MQGPDFVRPSQQAIEVLHGTGVGRALPPVAPAPARALAADLG